MCALQRAYNMLREVLFFKELPLVWLDLGKNMDSLSFGGPVPSFTLTPCGPWTPCNLYLEYILYLYERHLLSQAACIVYQCL